MPGLATSDLRKEPAHVRVVVSFSAFVTSRVTLYVPSSPAIALEAPEFEAGCASRRMDGKFGTVTVKAGLATFSSNALAPSHAASIDAIANRRDRCMMVLVKANR